jgi:hypothetical protein
MDTTRNARSSSISKLLNAFLLIGWALSFTPVAAAEDAVPAVSPIDKEQDLQSKLRLQEKIARELEENRRRALEQAKEKSEKGSDNALRQSNKPNSPIPDK